MLSRGGDRRKKCKGHYCGQNKFLHRLNLLEIHYLALLGDLS